MRIGLDLERIAYPAVHSEERGRSSTPDSGGTFKDVFSGIRRKYLPQFY